jgi:hypothetical protein
MAAPPQRCHYYKLTGLDANITSATCAQQCEAIKRAAPHVSFFYWSRWNLHYKVAEEGFDWLRAYDIAPNDCTTLDTQFKTRARQAREQQLVFAALTLVAAAAGARHYIVQRRLRRATFT